MLIKQEHRQFIRNMRAIPGKFHHALVVVDKIDKKNMEYSQKVML